MGCLHFQNAQKFTVNWFFLKNVRRNLPDVVSSCVPNILHCLNWDLIGSNAKLTGQYQLTKPITKDMCNRAYPLIYNRSYRLHITMKKFRNHRHLGFGSRVNALGLTSYANLIKSGKAVGIFSLVRQRVPLVARRFNSISGGQAQHVSRAAPMAAMRAANFWIGGFSSFEFGSVSQRKS